MQNIENHFSEYINRKGIKKVKTIIHLIDFIMLCKAVFKDDGRIDMLGLKSVARLVFKSLFKGLIVRFDANHGYLQAIM
jgi:hypothetical protein